MWPPGQLGRSLATDLCWLRVVGQVVLEFAVAELVAGACLHAGLVDETGVKLVTSHRFRHTVGTRLV